MKDYNKISVEILNFVGGKSNITNVTHCMTRLRINIINNDIDIESIKKINGVVGVVFSGGQLQIIIGQDVDELYKIFIGFISDVENQPQITKKKIINQYCVRCFVWLLNTINPYNNSIFNV